MSQIYLTSCVGLDHDIVLLDAFVRHYLDLGIRKENFLLVLNTSERGQVSTRIKEAIEILDRYGIEPFDIWCTRYESQEKWARVHAVLNKVVKPEDWVVHPDADEFHEITKSTFKELFDDYDTRGINAAQGVLIDRITEDLTVPSEHKYGDVFSMFPVCANLSGLLGITGVKLMCYRGYLRANNGSGQVHAQLKDKVNYCHGGTASLHEHPTAVKYLGTYQPQNPRQPENWTTIVDEIRQEIGLLVHHFKWHGRCIEKLDQRIETYTKLKRAQVFQSSRVLEHYRTNGKFKLIDATVKKDII